MDRLFDQFVVIAVIIAGISTLAVLHCAANAVRNHHQVHDLRVKVNQLRTMQMKRIKQHLGEESDNVNA